ncbi:MAG TPA: DUF4252 domain-containing protein [Chryseosolibacter sp.]|nr:DUF4252 domain-containing protein [Chryseosolibacter sp.]
MNDPTTTHTMNRKLLLVVIAALVSSGAAFGQSATTEALQKKHNDALNLFFYNNTLRMLNQQEDPEFDELIRDIEKMRFLMIKKSDANFGTSDYKKLLSEYKAEAFEEIMTSRHDGKNFDVYLKEKNGETKGMLVLINDASTLYILDILGRVALDKVTSLYSTLDESTDIGSKIKAFTGEGDDDDDEKGENE